MLDEFRPRASFSQVYIVFISFSFANLIHFKKNSIKGSIRSLEERKDKSKKKLGFSKFFQLTIREEIVPYVLGYIL